jgi:CheY-like chemotaxis protein
MNGTVFARCPLPMVGGTKSTVDVLNRHDEGVSIVDDDPGVRSGLAAFLVRSGLDVGTASDGEAAIVSISREHFDLVVMDVLMPRLDGREALRRLRQGGNWIPVILLTQVGEAAERAMALEEGADDYLKNPLRRMNWWPASGRCCADRRRGSHRSRPPGCWSAALCVWTAALGA